MTNDPRPGRRRNANAPPASNGSPVGDGVVWRNIVATTLCAIGMIAMVGDLVGSREMKGLGAASAMAPFPKVFCSLGGMEGFACEFTILYELEGRSQRLKITPETYSRLAGPYNRRNVYGAALAGGPKLPRPLWEAVFKYGFETNGPLRTELGVPQAATKVRVLVQSKTRSCDDVWILAPSK